MLRVAQKKASVNRVAGAFEKDKLALTLRKTNMQPQTHTLQRDITLYFTLYYMILSDTISYYMIPYHAIPCHTIPYHTIPHHTIP